MVSIEEDLRPRKKQKRVETDLYEQVLDDGPAPEDTKDAVDATSSLLRPLSQKELERVTARTDKSGIIYLSRIPPGMGPAQVRHQLAKYGDLGRVFLQRDHRDAAKPGKKKQSKHQAHRFVEGWIEFEDKKVARSVAEMLNARTIGGPKSSPFHDDIWTMKYLPKFKWNMLSEQVALEASTQQALLRNHLAQSKRDQAAYLNQVERARVDTKKEEKRASRLQRAQDRGEEPAIKEVATGKKRTFSQRTPVDSRKSVSSSKDLENVLQNLF